MRKIVLSLLFATAMSGAAFANQDQETCEGNDHPAAVAACTRILDNGGLTPSREAITRYYRAYSLGETGKRREAIADLDIAIELDPTDSDYFDLRGRNHRRIGEIEKAISDYSSAVEINPKNHSSWNGLGFIYEKRHELDRALAAYEKAVEAKPDFDTAHRNIGDVHAALGQFTQAIAAYNKAISIDRDDNDHIRSRGLAYFYMGDNHRAIEDLRKAVELNDPYAMLTLFIAQARIGEDGSAELRKNMIAGRDNRFPFILGEMLLGKRDAVSTLRTADDDDNRCEAHYYIGAFRSLKGDTAGAAQSWREAVKTCPGTIFEGISAKVELSKIADR